MKRMIAKEITGHQILYGAYLYQKYFCYLSGIEM